MTSWFLEKKALAENQIKRWERIYINPRIVYLFVRDALGTTRSPGKTAAYNEWIAAHPRAIEGFAEWLQTLNK